MKNDKDEAAKSLNWTGHVLSACVCMQPRILKRSANKIGADITRIIKLSNYE